LAAHSERPGDEFVLELAVAAGCNVSVTHNTKDFRGAERFGITIVTPGEFLVSLEEESWAV
jgi:predicted nucleic acid-binding protein